ncbi:MAG: NAD-dependent epimerase/dehydratase family protein [Candidatus Hodarchaeota archaeon]
MDQDSDVCLVTGACGFVGSHLVDCLLKQGFYVRATDLKSANRQYLPLTDQLEFVPADLTIPEEAKSVVNGVTKIFHTAGIFRFDFSRKLLYKVNVEGSTNLFSAALMEEISHFVNWSTAMIYGTLKYTPADEHHPIRPEESYSESKWLQEQMALSFYEENGLPISSIRPTAIYGPRSLYGTSRLILALANKKIFGIPSNGKTIQHHAHVNDVVNASIFIANDPRTIGEAYNIADDLPVSIEESFRVVLDFFEHDIPKIHFPKFLVSLYGYLDRFWNMITGKTSLYEKAALPLLFSDHIFNNSKLKQLGFIYSVPNLQTGIKSTLQWYRKHGYIKYPLNIE